MPIEVRELVIKATVNQTDTSTTPNSNNGGGKQDIDINEIVSLVFEKIKEKTER